MRKDIRNRICLDIIVLIISLLEFICCVFTRHAVLFITIEEICVILTFIFLGIYLYIKYKTVFYNIIIPFLIYFSIYIIAIINIFPYFLNTIQFGGEYYVTSYHFPGIITVDRILENITFSKIADQISVLVSQYLVSLIIMLFDIILNGYLILRKKKEIRNETEINC